MNALPTNEHGDIDTSAAFGHAVLVKITYTTDADGSRVVDDKGNLVEGWADFPQTFHGPFTDQDEAQAWMDAYPDDTDIEDIVTVPLNLVRPPEEPSNTEQQNNG